MSGKRFVALIAHDMGARSAWEQHSGDALIASAGFEKHVVGDRLALVAEVGQALAISREGLVVGTVFERGRDRALNSIAAEAAQSILASRGDWLIRAHWGSYVALLAARERDSVEVIRAPLGDLACYVMRSQFGLFLASDVDLLTRFAGYTPQIDWQGLAQHLAAADLGRRRTCLAGIDELAGGDRLTDSAGRVTIDTLWKIWEFVEPRTRLSEPVESARRVRDAVQLAVAGLSGEHDKVLLRLSGGLDSSVVAACLARAKRPFAALTLATRDRGGDERVHARAVARHLGVQLVEATRDVELVDLEISSAAGLSRPSARSFAQATSRIAGEAARAHGAQAIVDGGGGDNMFCSLQSPAPVADCLRNDGGAGHFWRTAHSIGIATQASTLEVARRAFVRSWTRGPAYRWPCDLSLLSPAAREMARPAADHPWLAPPDGALPGSAAHVALIAAAQSVAQGRHASVALPELSPLIAQPVAETCLRVPSWLWTRDGHNRAIAREAFRDALPPTIIDRRDKGAPDSFVVELIEANHRLIRAMLLDGVLAEQGLIDTAAVETAIRPSSLAKGYGYVRLMQLVDSEAWIRSWFGFGAGTVR